jgi:hypothetical protein
LGGYLHDLFGSGFVFMALKSIDKKAWLYTIAANEKTEVRL